MTEYYNFGAAPFDDEDKDEITLENYYKEISVGNYVLLGWTWIVDDKKKIITEISDAEIIKLCEKKGFRKPESRVPTMLNQYKCIESVDRILFLFTQKSTSDNPGQRQLHNHFFGLSTYLNKNNYCNMLVP